MYAYFYGKLIDKHPAKIVLEVAGIGYEISIPLSTFSKLPQLGKQVKINVHCCIKEDSHELYGFLTIEEKSLFQELISISGFGPKGAISVLSSISVPLFVNAVNFADTATLTSISGIGQKTAQRLILELKGKIDLQGDSVTVESGPGVISDNRIKDSIDALVSLGYSFPKARKSVEKAVGQLDENTATEDIIREALKKGGN